MRRIVIATHGALAKGYVDTLSMLGVPAGRVRSLGFYGDESCNESTIDELLNNVPAGDQLVICTDVGFGSVNQMFVRGLAARPHLDTLLVTGVNLPLVLELALDDKPLDEDGLAELVREASAQVCVVDVSSITKSAGTDEEDFF